MFHLILLLDDKILKVRNGRAKVKQKRPMLKTCDVAWCAYSFCIVFISTFIYNFTYTLFITSIITNFSGKKSFKKMSLFAPRLTPGPLVASVHLSLFRTLGKPRKSWSEVIRQDFSQLEIIEDMTLDRRL